MDEEVFELAKENDLSNVKEENTPMSDLTQNNIQISFDSTLKDTNLSNLAINFTELTIDSLLNNGLIKDLPIVGTLVNLSKIGANIQDKLFLKKILSFLNGLKDVPVEDRKKMIKDIDDSKKYRIKVGEKLLYIIDKSSDYEMSELLGVIFKYYIEGNITYDEFLKVSSVLNNLTINDFKWFVEKGQSYHFDLDAISDLIGSGLFDLHYEQIDVRVEDEDDHKILMERYASKYKTNIDGGGIDANVSRSGEIILEVFCLTYKNSGTIRKYRK
jgi:hypothetical protein